MKKAMLFMLICLLVSRVALAEGTLYDALIEQAQSEAAKLGNIVHDEDYLRMYLSDETMDSDYLKALQKIDSTKPQKAVVIVWNDNESLSFEHFYAKRDVHLEDDTLASIRFKLFEMPIDLSTGHNGVDCAYLSKVLSVRNAFSVEGLSGIGYVFLLYDDEHSMAVSAFGSSEESIAMSRTDLIYMEKRDQGIGLLLGLCASYFGLDAETWKEDVGI